MKLNREKNMSDEVVKSNRLNTAIQNLSLAELRIIQIGIIDARERNEGLSADKPLRIKALRYAEAFNVSNQTAYEVLLKAEATLFERRFSFINERDNQVKSRWVSQVEYIKGEGAIEIIFTPAVVREITRLDGTINPFTKYSLDHTFMLNSVYSVRLYELLVQHRTNRKKPLFDLEDFRGQLCLEDDEYRRMSDFKRRVLDLAVKEINEKTDLTVKYVQEKNGKVITGFKFTIHEKPKAKTAIKDVSESFKEMTDKQQSYFANKLANHDGFGGNHGKIGESTSDFESRIKVMLADTANQQKFLSELKFVGYEPRA